MQHASLWKRTALACAIALPLSAHAGSELDQLKLELAKQREQIAQQQVLLEKLSAALDNQQKQQAEALSAETAARTQALAAIAPAADAPFGSSVGAAAVAKTQVGGYGEVHYNNGTDDGAGSGRESNGNLHLHRAVLYLGHQFSDTVSFNSEFEFEGASDSTEIETEVEQFYIDWKARPNLGLKLGQWLVPVGIINERHEPDTFYGVERNPVETQIIPSTWWEKGVLASTQLTDDLGLDVAVSNGLRGEVFQGPDADGQGLGTPDGLREFRQEFGRSSSDDPAYTTRLRYTGINGLELAGTVQYQTNINNPDSTVAPGKAPAVLAEMHVDWRHGPYEVRALATRWDINNATAKTNGTDVLQGYYLEPAYRLNEKLGFFARYNRWNTAYNAAGSKDSVQTNIGLNYWIDPHVVLKADAQSSNAADNQGDGFNLGVGFSF